jgi:hypothetical protein
MEEEVSKRSQNDFKIKKQPVVALVPTISAPEKEVSVQDDVNSQKIHSQSIYRTSN